MTHSRTTDWNDVAARVLRVSNEETRPSEILCELAADHFLPSRDRHVAAIQLSGQSVPEFLLREYERRSVAKEVAEFAAGFFAINITQRSAAWQALFARSADFPASRHRLQELKPALTCTIPGDAGDAQEQKLIETAARLICMSAHARPAARRQFASELIGSGNIRLWKSAMIRLQRRHAAFFSLIPQFRQQMESLQPAVSQTRTVLPVGPPKRNAERGRYFWWGLVLSLCVLVACGHAISQFPSGRNDTQPETAAVDIRAVRTEHAAAAQDNANEWLLKKFLPGEVWTDFPTLTVSLNPQPASKQIAPSPAAVVGNLPSMLDVNVADLIGAASKQRRTFAEVLDAKRFNPKWTRKVQHLELLLLRLRASEADSAFLKRSSDRQLIEAVVSRSKTLQEQVAMARDEPALLSTIHQLSDDLGLLSDVSPIP